MTFDDLERLRLASGADHLKVVVQARWLKVTVPIVQGLTDRYEAAALVARDLGFTLVHFGGQEAPTSWERETDAGRQRLQFHFVPLTNPPKKWLDLGSRSRPPRP